MSDPELEAMDAVYAALSELDEGAQSRVLRWAADRFELDQAAPAASSDSPASDNGGSAGFAFESVGDLFQAASPNSGPERALVVGYWFQELDGRVNGWGGGDVNNVLKNMGHGLANVTKTLDLLGKRKPQLVMQVGKSGRSQQARKTYKLTTAGVSAVKEMMARPRQEDG